MTMMNTLLLDRDQWDLVLDANGNIAMAKPDYALAQDGASAIKTFSGECYYDDTIGIPYFEDILGHLPPASLLLGYMENAVLSVPGVVQAKAIVQSANNGSIAGAVSFIDENGVANGISF